jgi:hypothetical protein
MAEDKKLSELDMFIAQKVFPDARAIFLARTASVDQIKDDCQVVIDTNALLVPYTVSRESLEQIGQTYSKLAAQKRLVVPGQVAREFARNRAYKLAELYQQLSRKRNVRQFQEGSYPLLASLPEYQGVVRAERQLDKLVKDYQALIDKLLDHVQSWAWDDPVSLLYAQVFTEDVVVDPPIDEAELRSDLQRRQIHKLPPGYKDSSKADSGIGDLLIWHTILCLGKTHHRSVIFVSGDEKPDWWYQSENQALYPRYELVDEFRRSSGGQSFHIIKFSDLLRLYGATVKTVQEVRQEEIQVRAEPGLPASPPVQEARARGDTRWSRLSPNGSVAGTPARGYREGGT